MKRFTVTVTRATVTGKKFSLRSLDLHVGMFVIPRRKNLTNIIKKIEVELTFLSLSFYFYDLERDF